MKKMILAMALFLTCVSSNIETVWARSSPYELDIRSVKGDVDSSDKIVRLVNVKSHRIIWTRKVYGPEVFWSKDRRAVAVEGVYRLLVWREGYRVRDFAPIAPKSLGGSFDYFMGAAWSPDNRRLLVRFGRSGNSTMGIGALYCLKLGLWPRYQYKKAPGSYYVWEMAWRDSRTALFWPVDDKGGYPEKPRRWRVP